MNRFLWLLALILLVSCEKENLDTEALGKNADIVGVWIEEQPVDFTSNDYTLMVPSGSFSNWRIFDTVPT